MIELFSDLIVLYNKLHNIHIKTVNMMCCATLHPLLWEHYETLQSIVDRVWEDILIKSLNKDLPKLSQSIKQATISDDIDYKDEEEIVDDLCKDYEYIISDIKKLTNKQTDLLIQNILIDVRNEFTKLYADIERQKEDEEEMKKPVINLKK